jgi:YVTN family beta-propeller protein
MRRSAVLTCFAVLAFAVPSRAFADAPVTPAGWRVTPAGHEIGVPKDAQGFQGPLGSAVSPDGTHMLSVSSGAARNDSTDLFDLAAGRRTGFVPYDGRAGQAVFYGVVYSPDGKHAWASGGGQNVVHVYSVDNGSLTETGQIPVPSFPAGLAYGHTPQGDRIYVANNLSGPAGGTNPPGHQVTVIDPAANAVVGTIDLGTPLEPLGVAFSRDGGRAFVTNWMGRSVSVIDTASQAKVADVQLSPQSNPLQADHPSAIAANPQRDEVYVANANSDTVSVIDAHTNALLATIDVALVHGPQKGANPDGLSVSPDGRRLYVAEAGENALAVVNLDRRSVQGFIPTSWYPADVDVAAGGKALAVTNTNDSGAGPNPCGPLTPRPECPKPAPDSQYTGSMIKGSVQVLRTPSDGQLRRLTEQVRRNNQADPRAQRKPAALGKIKHVIYVLKENRTYDQVFGDLGKGNGDPSLALFKDDSAPNHRELARRFTTIDNFYADAEVSADGHNWSTQANATDYVDKTWPINYSPSPRSSQRAYDFEDVLPAQQFPTEPLASDTSVARTAAGQTRGYLWDNAYDHGVGFRDYAEYTQIPGDCTGGGNVSHVTRLDARFGNHVDNRYPGYNLQCSDHTQREPEFERDVNENGLAPLSIMRFPNDHTRGTTPGAATPKAYVSDNDLALGRLVQFISHSKYWDNTVILVTEDDAQNGPDHVDAHRTVALAISPYTQRAGVDSTHYDTSSMVATTEGLLGLPPMSIVDARVAPMWASFGSRPNLRPYGALTPSVRPYDGTSCAGQPTCPYDVNAATAPLAKVSAGWRFAKEDQAPEVALNTAIWKSVKGKRSRMPAPRHRIVGSTPTDER